MKSDGCIETGGKMAEILVGVTGGAAAFKAVTLVSSFRKAAFTVNTILTEGAKQFVTHTQFSAVSGRACFTDLFPAQESLLIPHIALTDNVDLMVIAPATAHFIARAANGFADDLLTAAFLACDSKIVIAPAMNTRMWNNPAVQANVDILKKRGIIFAGPVSGKLACGTEGDGRLMEPENIFSVCLNILNERV